MPQAVADPQAENEQQSGTSTGTAKPAAAPSVADPAAASVAGNDQGDDNADPGDDSQQTPQQQSNLPKGVLRRFGQLTKAREDAVAEAERLRQEVEQLRRAGQQQNNQQQNNTNTQQQDPRAIAEQIVAQREFDRNSNETYRKGKDEFADFDARLAELGSTGLLDRKALALIVDGDAPHKVLYHLATNFDDAMEILSLPERSMIRALARLEHKLSSERQAAAGDDNNQQTPPAPTPVTRAPRPVKPVGSRSSTPSGPNDKDAVSDWMAKRNKQLIDKRKAVH